MNDSERDISRALAAFGAPRLKYHSFTHSPLTQPDMPLDEPMAPSNQPAGVTEPVATPLTGLSVDTPSPTPLFTHEEVIPSPAASLSLVEPPVFMPPEPGALSAAPADPVVMPTMIGPLAASGGGGTPLAMPHNQKPRAHDSAMADIFNFLSMKPPAH